MAAAATVSRPSPWTPATAAPWIMPSENVQTLPTRFQGNPVRTQPLSHSKAVHTAAKTRMPPARLSPARRLTSAAPAGNRASKHASPKTAKGTIQPKRSGNVSRA